ncbi:MULTISPECIES: hypothetical protein [Priestia]|uniref:hypothetical protein n=1 Tax=Priestia TaxID=2800373 RepID=UPI001E566603|nr:MULTISPECIES: hypothetical protein [Priestia]MCR8924938.1 hypothetical protein [Priestia megaterium]
MIYLIIGIEYTKRVKNGLVVKNIPYKIHDKPCDEGCCKNDKTIGVRDKLRVNWLLNVFMPSKNITVFDYKYWSEELTSLWREHRRKTV